MPRTAKYKLDQVAIRMVKERPLLSDTPIHNASDAVRVMHELLKDLDREVVAVVNFQTDMRPINMNIISMGAVNASMAHPREILKSIILSNAAAVMLIHNHPSGRVQPSPEDRKVTSKVSELMSLMEIQFLDHIILGTGERYYSFRENNVLSLDTVWQGGTPLRESKDRER